MVVCDVCTTDPEMPTMMTEGLEWQAHRHSRRHRRNMQKYNQTVLPSYNHPTCSPPTSDQNTELELDIFTT